MGYPTWCYNRWMSDATVEAHILFFEGLWDEAYYQEELFPIDQKQEDLWTKTHTESQKKSLKLSWFNRWLKMCQMQGIDGKQLCT